MNGITKKLITGAVVLGIVIGVMFVTRFALMSWAAALRPPSVPYLLAEPQPAKTSPSIPTTEKAMI